MSGILSWDERYKKNLEAYKPDMDSDINEIKAYADKKAKTVTELYEGKISDTNQLYEDDLRENEVQKYINARDVAENNANLGLTYAGLNRTQQTAVQLSASNNAAKIERQRQSAVDELTRLMAADLLQIEDERYSSEQSVKSAYKQKASQAATDTYKADVEAYEKQVENDAETLKNRNSDYSILMSEIEEGLSGNRALARIYEWAENYEDFGENELINDNIRWMLEQAGLTEYDWNQHIYRMNGYRINADESNEKLEPIKIRKIKQTWFNWGNGVDKNDKYFINGKVFTGKEIYDYAVSKGHGEEVKAWLASDAVDDAATGIDIELSKEKYDRWELAGLQK